MIRPNQIEEWIREVEERPSSAPTIIRHIGNRLRELADRDEELLAENIALQTGKRVEEYEARIANLEYQLEMLKRQISGPVFAAKTDVSSLLIFEPQGRILRIELYPDDLVSADFLASFSGEIASIEELPRLLVVDPQEELLFVFDSGRTLTMPLAEVPAVDREALDWKRAFIQEPRGGEALATILPVARMAMFDFCVQISRRGFVKKIREAFLETCISKANVGTGVINPSDKTFDLALCVDDDVLVVISKEGHLLGIPIGQFPFKIEEALRLNSTDHIVSAFIPGEKTSILALTQNGKAFHRDMNWLEPTDSFKTRGRSILTKTRREAGMRIVGAAAVDEDDWGVVLTSDGRLTIYKMSDVFGAGTIPDSSTRLRILGFVAFSA